MRQIARCQSPYLRILEVLLLIVALAFALPRISRLLTEPKMAYSDDFAIYWAASQLAVAGQNPYDSALLLPLYRLVGHALDPQAIMWNPPWTIALVMPRFYCIRPLERSGSSCSWSLSPGR